MMDLSSPSISTIIIIERKSQHQMAKKGRASTFFHRHITQHKNKDDRSFSSKLTSSLLQEAPTTDYRPQTHYPKMMFSSSKPLQFFLTVAAVATTTTTTTTAFAPRTVVVRPGSSSTTTCLDAAKVGIFFGTSTGSTESVAEMIAEGLGDDIADGPFDVDDLDGSVADVFGKYDSLIVGTPTWNTGADTERSGTGWDELYYGDMTDLQPILNGKKVAVFGLGDQISYAENFADATGELHDVFENLGCTMVGYTSQEGYEHETSKSIRGDKFCGLLCDMVNQEELSEDRVTHWLEQLKEEGFFEAGTTAAATPAVAAVAAPVVEEQLETLETFSSLLDESIEQHSDDGYTPHFNPTTHSTMWTSSDGRSCYYTTTKTNMVSP